MGKEFVIERSAATLSMVIVGISTTLSMVIVGISVPECKGILDVVVSDRVADNELKIIAGRYVVVNDWQGVAEAARLFKNRDKRLWFHSDGWSEIVA